MLNEYGDDQTGSNFSMNTNYMDYQYFVNGSLLFLSRFYGFVFTSSIQILPENPHTLLAT